MRAGLATSVALHVLLLGVGMVSLSAPKSFEVADVESLPVSIIPFDEIAEVQQGAKEAPMLERPAPIPTQRPDPVEDAQNVGDSSVDTDAPPTDAPKPKPVQEAAEPPPAPAPTPTPKPAEKPVEEARVEPPAPAPAPPPPEPKPQPAQQAAPAQEPAPEAPVEPAPVETAANDDVALPDSAPIPQARPQPPKPQRVAEAPKPVERAPERPRQQTEPTKQSTLDEVAALLNKEKASGGGAKRSTEEAALGGRKTTGGEKLSQSEKAWLKERIQNYWSVPAGAEDAENIQFVMQFKLDINGMVEGTPQMVSGGSNSLVSRAAVESARRAILRGAPYNLPAEKFDDWKDISINFDLSDMF